MLVQDFFTTTDGRTAKLYSLVNGSGFRADVTDMGGSLVSIFTPDKDGRLRDVLLGYQDPAEYESNPNFFGALVGRVANRIGNGKLVLDGKLYQLELNDGANRPNTLHGGQSYGRRMWNAQVIDDATLKLTIESPDMDANFPGNLSVEVIYHVTPDNAIEIDYRAVTDKTTAVNLTNHAYFNLNGEDSGICSDHVVRSTAYAGTRVDSNLTPTGEVFKLTGIRDLSGGRKFEEIFESPELPYGFDDNFVIAEKSGTFRKEVFFVRSDASGITLAVDTDQCGVQFYMGYWLDGSTIGKSNAAYNHYAGFCLEAQAWPDAVNHSSFPSIILRPDEVYTQKTVYRFGTAK